MNLPDNDNRSVALLSKRRRSLASAALLAGLAWSSAGCVAYLRPHEEWNEPVDLGLDDESLKGVGIKVSCFLVNDAPADSHANPMLTELQDLMGGEQKPLMPQDDDTCAKLRVTIGETGARILYDEVPAEAAALTEKAPNAKETDAKASGIAGDAATRDRTKIRAKYPREIGDAKLEKPAFRVDYLSYETASDHCGKTILLLLFFGMGPCLEDIESRSLLVVTDVAKGTQIQKPLDVKVRRVMGAAALPLLLVDFFRPVSRQAYRRRAGEHLLEYIQNTVYSFAARKQLESERPRARGPDSPAAADGLIGLEAGT